MHSVVYAGSCMCGPGAAGLGQARPLQPRVCCPSKMCVQLCEGSVVVEAGIMAEAGRADGQFGQRENNNRSRIPLPVPALTPELVPPCIPICCFGWAASSEQNGAIYSETLVTVSAALARRTTRGQAIMNSEAAGRDVLAAFQVRT